VLGPVIACGRKAARDVMTKHPDTMIIKACEKRGRLVVRGFVDDDDFKVDALLA
jgi:hypothetical protein